MFGRLFLGNMLIDLMRSNLPSPFLSEPIDANFISSSSLLRTASSAPHFLILPLYRYPLPHLCAWALDTVSSSLLFHVPWTLCHGHIHFMLFSTVYLAVC